MVLTADDVEPKKSKKLSRSFRFETIRTRRPLLVEKLPINNFRLAFLTEIFPDARFVHIYRNGLEVARSIAAISERGDWFGANSYKWNRLAEYALCSDDTKELPAHCSSFYDKGLLEWRLSSEAVVEYCSQLAEDAYFELSYEEFVERPVQAISQVLSFIGLDDHSAVRDFVSEKLARRTSKMSQEGISDKEQLLGGMLLPLSMDGRKGLAKRYPSALWSVAE